MDSNDDVKRSNSVVSDDGDMINLDSNEEYERKENIELNHEGVFNYDISSDEETFNTYINLDKCKAVNAIIKKELRNGKLNEKEKKQLYISFKENAENAKEKSKEKSNEKSKGKTEEISKENNSSSSKNSDIFHDDLFLSESKGMNERKNK